MTDLPDEIPEIPLALLLYLEAVTKQVNPTPQMPVEQIMFDAGRHETVRLLRFIFDDQQRPTPPDDSADPQSDPRLRR